MREIEKGKAIYKFGAPWCVGCRQLTPITDSLKKEGYNIVDINIDEEQEFAEKYGIRSVPTSILLLNGEEIGRFIGQKTKEEIITLYNQI